MQKGKETVMRRIRKVKVDNRGKIVLDWEVKVAEGGWDEYHMKC
jgi:hypothetical protein